MLAAGIILGEEDGIRKEREKKRKQVEELKSKLKMKVLIKVEDIPDDCIFDNPTGVIDEIFNDIVKKEK